MGRPTNVPADHLPVFISRLGRGVPCLSFRVPDPDVVPTYVSVCRREGRPDRGGLEGRGGPRLRCHPVSTRDRTLRL